MTNGIDARYKEELNRRCVLNQPIPISRLANNLFWGCLDKAVGRGDGYAVLGGVIEVVSSITAVGHNIFKHSPHIYIQTEINLLYCHRE